MTLTFITYHSHNAKPERAWIAYVILPDGSPWDVPCYRATEADATEAVSNLYIREVEKGKRLGAYTDWATKPTVDAQAGGWPQHHLTGKFVGKVWMKNFATNERARVEPSQLAEYEAKGFIKAGPRS